MKGNNLAVLTRVSDHSISPVWPGENNSIFAFLHGKENYQCSVNGNGLSLLLNTKHFNHHALSTKLQPGFLLGCHLFLAGVLHQFLLEVCNWLPPSNWLMVQRMPLSYDTNGNLCSGGETGKTRAAFYSVIMVQYSQSSKERYQILINKALETPQ